MINSKTKKLSPGEELEIVDKIDIPPTIEGILFDYTNE